MLLYAITDRSQLPGINDAERRAALVSVAGEWAMRGIDYIQIREKDLASADLLAHTIDIVAAVRPHSLTTRILLNGPASIALKAAADGVHIPTGAPSSSASDARSLFASAGRSAVISYACHSREEVVGAREESQLNLDATAANTLILFAPVFEKTIPGETPLPGLGLEALHDAAEAARPIPVLALGGITCDNAPACLAAGADGIAAIRLFLGNDWTRMRTSQ